MEYQYLGTTGTSCMIRGSSYSDSIQEKQSIVADVCNNVEALLLPDVSNLFRSLPSVVRSNYFASGDSVSPIVLATVNKYNDKISSLATIVNLCLAYMNRRRYVELPEDLWLQIFIRLPVKSLLLGMCVCKQWYVLIKDPGFRRAHLQFQKTISTNSRGMMLLHRNASYWVISHMLFDATSTGKEAISPLPSSSCRNILPFSTSYQLGPFGIDGPINGLYCLHNSSGRSVLWNPATNEVGFLPLPEQCLVDKFFDDERYLVDSIAGFGTDPLYEDNYKVILFSDCISGWSDDEFVFVMLYTTRTNTWRLLDIDALMVLCPLNNTCLNGFYYWMEKNYTAIVVFDMNKESFRKISTPCHGEIALHNGRVTLFSMNKNLNELDIWVMLEGNNKWLKKSCVRGIQEPVLKPLGFCESENEILLLIGFCWSESQIIRYNTITQEIQNFGPRAYDDNPKACVYYDSFESLSGEITKYKGNDYASLVDMVGAFLSEEPQPF